MCCHPKMFFLLFVFWGTYWGWLYDPMLGACPVSAGGGVALPTPGLLRAAHSVTGTFLLLLHRSLCLPCFLSTRAALDQDCHDSIHSFSGFLWLPFSSLVIFILWKGLLFLGMDLHKYCIFFVHCGFNVSEENSGSLTWCEQFTEWKMSYSPIGRLKTGNGLKFRGMLLQDGYEVLVKTFKFDSDWLLQLGFLEWRGLVKSDFLVSF